MRGPPPIDATAAVIGVSEVSETRCFDSIEHKTVSVCVASVQESEEGNRRENTVMEKNFQLCTFFSRTCNDVAEQARDFGMTVRSETFSLCPSLLGDTDS